MDDWRLQGLGRAAPWKQALFLWKGRVTKETMGPRMENEQMKFRVCVQAIEGAEGQNYLKYSEGH